MLYKRIKKSISAIHLPDNCSIILETVKMYNSLTSKLTPMMYFYFGWFCHNHFDKSFINDLQRIISDTNGKYEDKKICLEMVRRNSRNI